MTAKKKRIIIDYARLLFHAFLASLNVILAV